MEHSECSFNFIICRVTCARVLGLGLFFRCNNVVFTAWYWWMHSFCELNCLTTLQNGVITSPHLLVFTLVDDRGNYFLDDGIYEVINR